jgi:hypothetical protein
MNSNIGMYKILAIGLVLSVNNESSAEYNSYFWQPQANTLSGEVSYTGPEIPSIITTVSNIKIYQSSVVGGECDHAFNGGDYIKNNEWFIFIPDQVTINGKTLYISVNQFSPWVVDKMGVSGYGAAYYTQNIDSYVDMTRRTCPYSPMTYNFGGRPSKPLSITINISNLDVGSYTGTITVKALFVETFWSGSLKVPSFPTAYIYSSGQNLPVNITIRNDCRTSSPSIILDHGSLSFPEATGNEELEPIVITCTSDASMQLKLSSTQSPSGTYANVGVGLGNGWDSELYLTDKSTGASGGNITVALTANQGKTVDITSILRQTSTSTAGSLQGSAILTMTLQ